MNELILPSKNIEWIPIQEDRWLQSPYFLSEPIHLKEYEWLALCLHKLAFPPDLEIDEYWKTDVGKVFLFFRQYAVGEFTRKHINKDFPYWKLERYFPKLFKELIRLECEILGEIWTLIRLLSDIPNPRPLALYDIALENQLLFFFAFVWDEKNDNKPTATNKRKEFQKINRSLQSLKNPFDSEVAPNTWKFVERCRVTADRSDSFRKSYHNMISMRMKVLTIMKESHPKLQRGKGVSVEQRGRRKKIAK